MRILLVEDEPLAQDRIKSILEHHFPSWTIHSAVQSIKELREELKSPDAFDIILCDIHLADGLSFKAFEGREIAHPVVFITAYDQYALQSFDHNCIDYVLKPIDENRMVLACQKAEKLCVSNSGLNLNSKLIDRLIRYYNSNSYKKRFLVKIGNKFSFISSDKIAYFYSEEGITYVVEIGSSSRYMIDHSLQELQDDLLDPQQFYRVNRSIIINLDGLMEIKPYLNGRLVLSLNARSEAAIVVARERVSEFKNWINQ